MKPLHPYLPALALALLVPGTLAADVIEKDKRDELLHETRELLDTNVPRYQSLIAEATNPFFREPEEPDEPEIAAQKTPTTPEKTEPEPVQVVSRKALLNIAARKLGLGTSLGQMKMGDNYFLQTTLGLKREGDQFPIGYKDQTYLITFTDINSESFTLSLEDESVVFPIAEETKGTIRPGVRLKERQGVNLKPPAEQNSENNTQ